MTVSSAAIGGSGGKVLAVGLLLCLSMVGCQTDGAAAAGERRQRSHASLKGETPRKASARSRDTEELADRGILADANGGADPGPGEEAAPEEPPSPSPEDAAPAEDSAKEDGAKEDGANDESAGDAPSKPPSPAAKGAATPPNRTGRNPRTAKEALSDLQETGKFQQSEAEYHAKLGDQAYHELDYKTALKEYRTALDLNPALSDVREKWARCGLVLGVRSAEIDSIRRDFVDAYGIKKQQWYAEAKLGLKEAEELLQTGDYPNAEKKYRKVYEELLWFEYPVDVSDLRAAAKDGIARVAVLKKEADTGQRRNLEEEAKRQLELQMDLDRKNRDQQVRDLVRRAADYIRLKDYEKAIDACTRILELKPDHRVAKFWLRDMKKQQVEQRQLHYFRDRKENEKLQEEGMWESAIPQTEPFIFPEQKDWNIVRRRKETMEVVTFDDPEWIRRIKNSLEAKVSFAFEQRPLKDVLPFLQEQVGINIMADPEVKTEEFLIDLNAKDMKASDALAQILLQTNLGYTFREGFLLIAPKEKAKGDVKFSIYNVSDILNKIRVFEGPTIQLKTKDEQSAGGSGGGSGSISLQQGSVEAAEPIDPTTLIDLIKEGSGGEEVWGENNTIEFHKGQLMVNATKELHAQISTTLKNLREDSDLFVVIEARFLDINDDFLEDIGLDSRALGAVNNFGTPFGTIINDNSTGGNDIGFVKQGSPVRDVTLIMGQDRWAGRVQHIVDGFTGLVTGSALHGGPGGIGGLTAQATWLEPFQINVILRAVQEKSDVRQLTAPVITAHNGQRVYVSVITQRAYIADYELVSGGTGFSIIEVADPVVQTFQDGVILDVDPVISPDKKYITLDVRPTLANLIGGVISTIHISLGSFTNVAFQVPIGVPQISLQQSYTSVTVPNGGTVLLGGFKSLVDEKFESYLPIMGKIPILKNLFRRKAQILEKRSLVILINARIIDLRADELKRYNEG